MTSEKSLQNDEPLQWKKVLLFCLPALAVALVLRVILMANMPYAFVISDTREFAGTSLSMASHGLNPFGSTSRTLLAKVLYAFPVFVHQPILPWAAFIQHVFGLGAVVAAGFLCRLWLTRWRWWIIPFTLIVAVHPTLLWYEHMALPDSSFVFFVLASSALGGLYYRRPSAKGLRWFAAALILAAASRQEGFLFLIFGLLLVASRHRREFATEWRRVAVMAGIILLGYLTSKTTQGGQMLLTSTIHMAPSQLWLTKDFSAEAVRLRDQFRPRWPAYPADHNSSRKIITHAVEDFHLARGGKSSDKENNKFCKRVAEEIALRNWWRLPGMALNKFRATHLEPPSPDFGEAWAHDKHVRIFYGKSSSTKPPKDRRYMKAYYGTEFADREEATAFFREKYRVENLHWLTQFQRYFIKAELGWKFPDVIVESDYARDVSNMGGKVPLSGDAASSASSGPQEEKIIKGQILPGISGIYLLGGLGLLAAAFRSRSWLSYRQLWLLVLLFEAFVVFVTGSLRSRYRLIYEPWWFLGLFCALDAVIAFFRGGWRAWRDGDGVEEENRDGEESPAAATSAPASDSATP